MGASKLMPLYEKDDNHPAHIEELIPGDPVHLGACNAAKTGMGRVWITGDNQALLWQQPFADNIQKQLVSFNNPVVFRLGTG
jgi:hypothetical protein